MTQKPQTYFRALPYPISHVQTPTGLVQNVNWVFAAEDPLEALKYARETLLVITYKPQGLKHP